MYCICSEETWTGYFVVYISVSSVHKNREFVCVCVWPWFVVGDGLFFYVINTQHNQGEKYLCLWQKSNNVTVFLHSKGDTKVILLVTQQWHSYSNSKVLKITQKGCSSFSSTPFRTSCRRLGRAAQPLTNSIWTWSSSPALSACGRSGLSPWAPRFTRTCPGALGWAPPTRQSLTWSCLSTILELKESVILNNKIE